MRWLASILFLCIGITSVAQEEAIAFSQVDIPPRYKDCSASTTQQERSCTQEAVEAFAKQKFNTGLFKNLNLNEKRIRVYAQLL